MQQLVLCAGHEADVMDNARDAVEQPSPMTFQLCSLAMSRLPGSSPPIKLVSSQA